MATHSRLIKENVAPQDAAAIGVIKGGSVVGQIPLGTLAKSRDTKRFSFGLFSDVHLCDSNTEYYLNSEAKFKKALDFCKTYGVEAAMICGDITRSQSVSDYNRYKTIRGQYSFPIYTCAGNHDLGYAKNYGESDSNYVTNDSGWNTYTGQSTVNSYTTITKNGKKYYFIFLSIKKWRGADTDDTSWASTTNALYDSDDIKKSDGSGWLETTLRNCQDGKCFVFVHAPVPEYSGDFGYGYDQRSVLLGKNLTGIKELSQTYKDNVIWFHGHTHNPWELQGIEYTNTDTANKLVKRGAITQAQANQGKGTNRDANIFPCDGAAKTTGWHVHVPSSNSVSCHEDYPYTNRGGSQFAIVDVYDDCVEIKGCGFRCDPTTGEITSEVKFIPIADYILEFKTSSVYFYYISNTIRTSDGWLELNGSKISAPKADTQYLVKFVRYSNGDSAEMLYGNATDYSFREISSYDQSDDSYVAIRNIDYSFDANGRMLVTFPGSGMYRIKCLWHRDSDGAEISSVLIVSIRY